MSPWPALDGIFRLKEAKDNGNLIYSCLLCLPATKSISTSKASYSNLKKHVKVSKFIRLFWCAEFESFLQAPMSERYIP